MMFAEYSGGEKEGEGLGGTGPPFQKLACFTIST